ncbi:MAG: AMP-binding protein [Chromatocurvus sp.]
MEVSYRPDAFAGYRNTTIAAAARAKAQQQPDDVAIFLDTGEELTFSAIYEEARALASALRRLGLSRGDVVSFQLPNWREPVAINIACSMLGLVINPIIPIYRDRELAFILRDTRARALFIPDVFRGFDYPSMIEALRDGLPDLEQVIVVKAERAIQGLESYDALLAAASEQDTTEDGAVNPDDVKIVMYTSGTTGNPKAVRHSHNTLARALDNGVDAWNLGGADVMLMPSPVTHITGFCNGMELPFFTNARAAFMQRWNVDEAIELIERTRASICISATPFLNELVMAAEERGLGLPSMRLFACGGASVPPQLIRRTHRVLDNCRAFRVYGSTEAPLVTTGFQLPEEEDLAAGTDGHIYNYEVRVLDDAGQVLPVGADGEIALRGPTLMLGYGDVGQTKDAFDADGFFLTGDIGHVTDRAAIVITDRKKDIIIRGGENLSAREIEEVILDYPDVVEAAVVAMPHERLGEGVAVYVVLRDKCDPLTLEQLVAFLAKSGMAKQKWPQYLQVAEELPKTASGKVRKDALRRELREQVQAPQR